jgi:uncharacterized protein (DUF58 family)
LAFFVALGVVIFFFIMSFFIKPLYLVSVALFMTLVMLTIIDSVFLFFSGRKITARRVLPEKLSNGDENPVEIHIKNQFGMNLD